MRTTPALAVAALLAGCQTSAAKAPSSPVPRPGVVIGVLRMVGGPYGTPAEPAPGLVAVYKAGADPRTEHPVARTSTDGHGRFSVTVPAGRYSLRGSSALYESGARMACGSLHTALVRPTSTTISNIYCEMP